MDGEDRCYEAALNILAIRWHGEVEIRRKLRRRKFEDEEIAGAVARLHRENLLNDERYASAYARSRLRASYGRNRIAQELEQRGVPESTRRIAIAQALGDESEHDYLTVACRKRLGQMLGRKGGDDSSSVRQKLIAHLVRKGFALSEVFSVVDDELRKAGRDADDVSYDS